MDQKKVWRHFGVSHALGYMGISQCLDSVHSCHEWDFSGCLEVSYVGPRAKAWERATWAGPHLSAQWWLPSEGCRRFWVLTNWSTSTLMSLWKLSHSHLNESPTSTYQFFFLHLDSWRSQGFVCGLLLLLFLFFFWGLKITKVHIIENTDFPAIATRSCVSSTYFSAVG